jgi:hypothetical protein
MKKIIFTVSLIVLSFSVGCETDFFTPDLTPPRPPTGLQALALDNQVNLDWYLSRDADIAGYNVYVSSSYSGKYILIGSTHNNYFKDIDAVNGTTYYYAVTAYDESNNESDLSRDAVYATPRPEGFDVIITDYRTQPSTAGYDFSTNSILRFDNLATDMFFENYNGQYYMDVWDNADIKDMGFTNSFDDITVAPLSGWSTTKDALLAVGKTCVVWTYDDH